jgi:hypothetical protein
MKIVRLNSSFYNCPAPWQNMIHHLQLEDDREVPLETINCELAKYGGKYRPGRTFSRIDFDTAAAYTMFVLRWA